MQDLFKTMLTPGWIVSTVVVSVILNVLSGYLKDGVDKLFALLSDRTAQASTHRALARKALVARLGTDPPFRRQYRINRLRDAYMAATGSVTGIVIVMATLAEPSRPHASWWFTPAPDSVRITLTLFALLVLTTAQVFATACFYRSAMLIRSEHESPAAPVADVAKGQVEREESA